MAEIEEQEQEMESKPPFFARIKNLFSKQSADSKPEEARYKRRFFDGRIERYLDENFNNYIDEFGLVTRVDTLEYEEKYDSLVQRITSLKTYDNGSDAELSSLERRLKNVKTASKKKTKKK